MFTRRWLSKDSGTSSNPIPENNPNPRNYIIVQHIECRGHLLVNINYPDCKNYEGDKILLYKDLTLNDLRKQEVIDPHFNKSDRYKFPFARFEPTLAGWNIGRKVMEELL